jgi:NADH dehydrogenase [ubiquinone] 1 alpha subcomplex assembly factor 3
MKRALKCQHSSNISVAQHQSFSKSHSAMPLTLVRPVGRIIRASTGSSRPFRLPLTPSATLRQNSSDNKPPAYDKPTSFDDLNMSSPAPSTAVESCSSDGFALNNGVQIRDGSGLFLLGGEAFKWRPWLSPGIQGKSAFKGDIWDIPDDSFALLGLSWPRPGKRIALQRWTHRS